MSSRDRARDEGAPESCLEGLTRSGTTSPPEVGRELVERLLGLWENADPDLPLLAEVRAMG